MNGDRIVYGTLRGFDVFMNIVLDDSYEETPGEAKLSMNTCILRGNSIISVEVLDRVDENPWKK